MLNNGAGRVVRPDDLDGIVALLGVRGDAEGTTT